MERTGPYGKKDTYLGFPLESEVIANSNCVWLLLEDPISGAEWKGG